MTNQRFVLKAYSGVAFKIIIIRAYSASLLWSRLL